jgi:adenylate cyclase
MQRKLAQMNQEWARAGRPEFHSGIGINSGEMIAGNVGAESIRSYTVSGDNVNLGSRLESQCKEYKVEIIISEFTRALLKLSYSIEELGEVLVKGKSKPVTIFQVRHAKGDQP